MECIFCEIVKGNIPCDKVYEDENVLAFRDIAPQAPVHIVIIPKFHFENILEVNPDNFKIGSIIESVKQIAKLEGLEEDGFRLVNNCKDDGGQTVNHLHFHLLGKRKLQWPPG